VVSFALKHPTATIARGIENLVMARADSKSLTVKVGYQILATTISVTVFPIFLGIELFFKRIPIALRSISLSGKKVNSDGGLTPFQKNLDKVAKFAFGIIFSPFGLRWVDSISGFFLKRHHTTTGIYPFGVEGIYGKTVSPIQYPNTIEELQNLVKNAIKRNQQISVIGAGMSQGTQTIPEKADHLVIHTQFLKQIEIDENNNTATIGSGATWEQVQQALNQKGKSSIVKQASDPFSIGGSISINCHGWAHEYGSISSVVKSLRIINDKGELVTLTPKDEQFGCMFGTLGWFGIVVDVTFKIRDNVHLVEKSERVELQDFDRVYKDKIKGKGIPLFGGRLCLDALKGNPLRYVEMDRFEEDEKVDLKFKAIPLVTPNLFLEEESGTRMQRISLQATAHFTYFTVSRLLSNFWKRESDKMHQKTKMTLNEALHPPINALKMLHHSNLHSQWLQEYFIKPENLPYFLRYLGAELKANGVKLINATIRPTPKDTISILPYAEQDRYAVVLCFNQYKTQKEIARTRRWIEKVNRQLIAQGDVYYQAYMPYATQEQFETCYGKERVQKMRDLKQKYDPQNRFGNGHTAKYFEKKCS